MRIESASRKLPTDGDLIHHLKVQSSLGGGAMKGSKNRSKVFALGENQGTFTGLYQNDLTSSQYQRRVGTWDVKQNTDT